MATKLTPSTKRLQISKANATMVAAIAIGMFIVVFSLVASRALLSQRSYQARVISKKEKSRDKLKANVAATTELITRYKAFVGSAENVIGGNSAGQREKDGDNARIILDALPSKYDFPALTTSLEKLMVQNNLKIESITGTDDEVAQQTNADSSNPKPIDMPFELSVDGPSAAIKNLSSIFELSIRPFSITSMKLSGSDGKLLLNLKANSYYQPQRNLKINTEVIK